MSRSNRSITQVFDLYLEKARELEQTRLIRSEPSSRIAMQINPDGATTVTSEELPDEEDLRSFLVTFRQFVSPKEPIYLHHIHDLLFQRLIDDELRNHAVNARATLKHLAQGNGIQVQHNDHDITPKLLLDLWINGVYFHNDLAKRRELERLLPYPVLMARHRFLMHIFAVQGHISYIGSLINHARREGLLDEG